MNIVREKEAGTLDQLNVTPITRATFIAAKLIPLWSLALLDLALGLALAHFALGVPVRGSCWSRSASWTSRGARSATSRRRGRRWSAWRRARRATRRAARSPG